MTIFNSNGLIGVKQVNSVDFVKSVFQIYSSGAVLVIIKQKNHGLNLIEEREPKLGGGWINLKQDVIIENRPAQVVFTSGTEGNPKAILISHRALADVVIRLNNIMQVDETISEYVGVPVSYSFGLGRCRAVAAIGGRCFIPENGFNPAELSRMLAADEINAISAVPTLWRTLLVNPAIIGSLGRKVKWIEIGSQFMSKKEKEGMKDLFPNARIVQHYGLTEASRTTFLEVSDIDGKYLESVGKATGDVEIKISQDGLIMIRGPHVAVGQIIDNQVKKIVDDENWYTTGDFGKLENGFLFYEGRADDLINCGGVKVSPDLLQEQITRRLQVDSGIAVSRIDDDLRGDGFFIAVESSSGLRIDDVHKASIDELLQLGINAQSSVKVQLVGKIPRTDTGKIRRKELSKLYTKTSVNVNGQAKTDETRSISDLYADMFPGVEIKPTDTFRTLGGDSLNYIQMLMLLEARFGFAPSDWDMMPVETLENIQRKDNLSIFSWLDTSILLRVIAILGVVATHSGGSALGGGTMLLFVLIGYNIARFKSAEFFKGNIWPWLRTYSMIILIPYFIAIILYLGWNRSFEIDELLLYANLVKARITMFFPFWFVQVLLQCLLVLGVAFSVHSFRHQASKTPVKFSFAILAILILVRATYPLYWNTEPLYDLVPLRFMAIMWLGWCFYFVKNFLQKMVLCMAGIGFAVLDIWMLWRFDFSSPEASFIGGAGWLIIGSIFLAFVPHVPVPRFTKKFLNDIGAATFYIFIFNGLIIKLVEHTFRIESVIIVFLLTLIGSMSIWWVMERLKIISRLKSIMDVKTKNQA